MRYVVAYLKAGSLLCHHTPAISQPLSGQLHGWLPLSCPAGATAQHEIIHEHSCFIHAHSCVPLVASGKVERVLRRRHKYICPRRNLPVFRRPSGAVVGRRLYRGVAPACIPSPLRGYCVHFPQFSADKLTKPPSLGEGLGVGFLASYGWANIMSTMARKSVASTVPLPSTSAWLKLKPSGTTPFTK